MTESNKEQAASNQFEMLVNWGEGDTQWSHEMLRVHFERFMAEEYSKPELDRSASDYQSFQTACLFMGFVQGAWFMEAFRNMVQPNYATMSQDFPKLRDLLLGASMSLNNIGREELADSVTVASELLTMAHDQSKNEMNETRLNSEIHDVLNRVLWTKNASDQNKDILANSLVRTIISALKE